MLGSIIGDIVGSRFEGADKHPKIKYFKFFHKNCRFTDDTVLSIAVMDALMNGKNYSSKFREYYKQYPNRGYGRGFRTWAMGDVEEGYCSFGNGSAMRVAPVGYLFKERGCLGDSIIEAQKSAEVTHNHLEGIKGAQAIAICVNSAWRGKSKKEILNLIKDLVGYEEKNGLLVETNVNFCSCRDTVPQAINAFLESRNFKDSIRIAILKGGDSDTIASMTGAISEGFYGLPKGFKDKVYEYIPKDFKIKICEFYGFVKNIEMKNK
jgi:ADP-ribosylglycohydrolase